MPFLITFFISGKDVISLELRPLDFGVITVISRKVVGKKVHATIPKGNMGYDQYTVPNDCSCRTYFCCFPIAIANITSQTSCAILSNFFEEQCTQNHPQYLSGLSGALFPTTFLEIQLYTRVLYSLRPQTYFRSSLTRVLNQFRNK